MDNKVQQTTKRLRRAWITAISLTIIFANTILQFFLTGDDTHLWLGIASIPILVSLWATVFQRGVEDEESAAGEGGEVFMTRAAIHIWRFSAHSRNAWGRAAAS